jgi:molybdopterin-binding protein
MTMKISARNVLKGKVLDVKEGPVNSQVHVEIGGGNTITSMITTDAARDLGVAQGRDVYVVIKASEVMLATD